MTAPTGAVFISYASEDAEQAEHIADALRSAGVEVWFDQNELRGGDAWDRHIRKQIHDCSLFMPVISASADARTEGYFRREWRLAVDRTHDMADDTPFLIPVVIDSTHDSIARVPDQFRHVQWTRLPSGKTPTAFLERIVHLLARDQRISPTQVRQQTSPRSATVAPPEGKERTSWWSQTVFLTGAVGLIFTMAGFVAFDRFVLSKHVVSSSQRADSTARFAASKSAAVSGQSIAVLPFIDMSEKHDQEYFGDGMAEEILNLLVKIPDLKVIGRTSSFRFKGKADDLRTIGAALDAAYVVEGSVRRSGDHIRVTAQLIDARDGVHRWSETYDRDARDILKIQGEIAAGLVRALQLEVTAADQLLIRKSVRNSEAYDVYLRGLHASNRYDQAGFEEAVSDFRRALELDPTFILAAEQLATNLASLTDWGYLPTQSGWEQARVSAQEALKLDSKSGRAHAVLGYVHTLYDMDWPGAEEEFRTALALSPHDPMVLEYSAMERLAVGKWADTLHLLDSATTADPLDPGIYEVRVWAYLRMGRFAEAMSASRRLLEIAPTYAWGHYDLGLSLLLNGTLADALEEIQQETAVEGRLSGLAVVYQALHRTKDANEALARLETDHASDGAMDIARVHAFRGQKDAAFKWLDRAYTQRDTELFLVKGDPLLRSLAGDPRYGAFLRKMTLPE